METKKSIRHIIRKQRKELDPMIWQSQTAEICRKTCELDVFREATDIYCYIDFGGEVGTRPLMLEAWKLGKTVWVPKVHGETMDFYEITSFDELKPGAYGILEPDAGIPASADDGLMIMPGVAFDTNRNRVGYGGGYYDRYLELHPQLHTLALAFDMQVLFEVPAEEQDIKPQLLVTETNIYQEG